MTRSVMMSELSWTEYKRRLEEEDAIVILPVGAIWPADPQACTL